MSANGMGHLAYSKHFAGLAIAAAVLLGTGQWYRSRGGLFAVAVYAALHSSVTAVTLRNRYSLRRKLFFIGCAAVFSGLSFCVARYGGLWLGWSAPVPYLVVCGGVGAIFYALLLRRLFIANLSWRAMLLIAMASVFAVLCVYLSGLYVHTIDVLAWAWWFAFSASLWCEDRRHALVLSRSRDSIRTRSS